MMNVFRPLFLLVSVLFAACAASQAPAAAPRSPAQPEAGGVETPGESPADPAASPPGADEVAEIECKREGVFGPVMVTPEQYMRRIGADATAFSALQTTKERPIEVCGVARQLDFLTQVECDDGSNPFASRRAAHMSRRGSMGAGGRCGSIIDLYEVPCPEGRYEVHMDAYICTDGLSWK